jgi:hypothetical protein
MLVYYKADIISLKCRLFSPWYSWKIAHLALNNTNSLYVHVQFEQFTSKVFNINNKPEILKDVNIDLFDIVHIIKINKIHNK